MKSGVKMGEIC